jgi:hypothetical protein
MQDEQSAAVTRAAKYIENQAEIVLADAKIKKYK